MANEPLISFCIATYKRQELLKLTIAAIFKQDYKNLEIVVSDNDPLGSAKKVVDSFKSNKLIYHRNKTNIGMIKNFNEAFSHSHGDYIIFVADDDPPEPQLLSWLMKLRQKFPDAGSYFGAANYLVEDTLIPKLHPGLKLGRNSQINKNIKLDTIKLIDSSEFLAKFLRYEILNYFLWSCGMVRRDIVKKAEGFKAMNGSNFLTDSAYILRVGQLDDMVVINKPLGSQRIHLGNFGRKNEDLLTLQKGLQGFYEQSIEQARKNDCQADLEIFLRGWIKEALLGILRFRKLTHQKADRSFIVKIYNDIANEYSFFKKDYFYFYSRAYFPAIMELFDKHKWVFEIRNFKLLGIKLLKFLKAT